MAKKIVSFDVFEQVMTKISSMFKNKSDVGHVHEDYASKEHTHDDYMLATTSDENSLFSLLESVDITQFTFAITATPSDAIIKINGVIQNSVIVERGSIVVWEVSMNGYVTQNGASVVTANEILTIDLAVKEPETLNADEWIYTVFGNYVGLNKYVGSATDITVYNKYKVNGVVYDTTIDFSKVGGSSYVGLFQDNTTIESVTFEDGILYSQASSFNLNKSSNMFSGCTALKYVYNVPPMLDTISSANRTASSMYMGCRSLINGAIPLNACGWAQVYQNCSSLEIEITEIPNYVTSMYYAFAGAKITSLPDIPSNVNNIVNMCNGGNSLIFVGTIRADVTDMTNAFRTQSNLSGTVRIETTGITTMTNAFSSNAIPNITFEVPANSTTYETLIATYPSATIVTF